MLKNIRSPSTGSRQNSDKVSKYKKTTSVGTLRKHLYTEHPKDWSDECKARGIRITAKSALAALAAFFGVEPEPQEARPQFSPERFVDSLVEFIVANDLVCLFFFTFFIYIIDNYV
jgi:hypothetical protein